MVALVAILARAPLVAWAWSRIPPTGDGAFYHLFAGRLAAGLGYSIQWPDGVVTPVAHYPVGYPALLAPFYALLGAAPGWAMVVNTALSAMGAVAIQTLAARVTTARRAAAAGLFVALHPALLFYTPAVMTELATFALVAAAFALADTERRRWGRLALASLLLGGATLVRPQSLLFAPVLGALCVPGRPALARRVIGAALACALTVGVCLPWTARNCREMGQCALVSVNGGWNLLIGTHTTSGSWEAVKVPDACREVWDEAAKDRCFGREAQRAILASPGEALAKVPRKLAATFDYVGAAPWYLHAANPDAFPTTAKVVLGAFETVVIRAALVLALLALARARGRYRRARALLAALGIVSALLPSAAFAYLALALAAVLGQPAGRARGTLRPLAAATIVLTMLVHGAFFGGGRYALVVLPFVAALAVAGPRDRVASARVG